MSDKQKAFPQTFYPQKDAPWDNGMDLRDWFAGQVLGHLAAQLGCAQKESVARRCYAYADAMIEMRGEVIGDEP